MQLSRVHSTLLIISQFHRWFARIELDSKDDAPTEFIESEGPVLGTSLLILKLSELISLSPFQAFPEG